jgi:beta-glucanase (GH16 family)
MQIDETRPDRPYDPSAVRAIPGRRRFLDSCDAIPGAQAFAPAQPAHGPPSAVTTLQKGYVMRPLQSLAAVRPTCRISRAGRAALALLLAATTLAVLAPASPASAAMIWSDEFNSAAGTGIDGSKWNHDVGGSGWGNNQLEYDTNSTANSAHDGQGNLVITALPGSGGNNCWNGPCQYTSARLNTWGKFSVQTGILESRMWIPCGQGLWPAFWALGTDLGNVGWPNSGEIDVMENVGFEPNTTHGSLHGPGYFGAGSRSGTRSVGTPLCWGFHVYSAVWTSNDISFYLDGAEYARFNSSQASPWVFNKPFFLLLNLAVGGFWPGSPDASTFFPARLRVDYVRVFSL